MLATIRFDMACQHTIKHADGCNSCRVMLIESFDCVPSAAAYLHEPAMLPPSLCLSPTPAAAARPLACLCADVAARPLACHSSRPPCPLLACHRLACQTAGWPARPLLKLFSRAASPGTTQAGKTAAAAKWQSKQHLCRVRLSASQAPREHQHQDRHVHPIAAQLDAVRVLEVVQLVVPR